MRIAAGLFLYQQADDGETRFLLLRNARRKEWGFPKGHREEGETLRSCALRECAEECGIGLLSISKEFCDLHYEISYTKNAKNKKSKKQKIKKKSVSEEKTVRYFLAKTSQSRVRLSKEHNEFYWANAKEVLDLITFDNLRQCFSEAFQLAANK